MTSSDQVTGNLFPEPPPDMVAGAGPAARYAAVLGEVKAQLDAARTRDEKVREERVQQQGADEALARTKAQKDYEAAIAEAAADATKARSKELKDYETSLVESSAEEALRRTKDQKEFEADLESAKAFYGGLSDLAKGGIERARAGAQGVQTAAAAVATLYTGVLGLAFAADGTKLPLIGLVPAVFLALAISCAAVYSAYLTPTDRIAVGAAPSSTISAMEQRAFLLVRAANMITSNRAYWSRCAVLGLGTSVLTLPLPFLNVQGGVVAFLIYVAVGVVVCIGLPYLIGRIAN